MATAVSSSLCSVLEGSGSLGTRPNQAVTQRGGEKVGEVELLRTERSRALECSDLDSAAPGAGGLLCFWDPLLHSPSFILLIILTLIDLNVID